MPAPVRPAMAAGAEGPADHELPSHNHVWLDGGHSLGPAPPNITNRWETGSYAMLAPPRGARPAGGAGAFVHTPAWRTQVSLYQPSVRPAGPPPNRTTWSAGGK